jgi:hypothetical protein
MRRAALAAVVGALSAGGVALVASCAAIVGVSDVHLEDADTEVTVQDAAIADAPADASADAPADAPGDAPADVLQPGRCPAFCDGGEVLCDDFSGSGLLPQWTRQIPDGGNVEIVDGGVCTTEVRITSPPAPVSTRTFLTRTFALPDAAALSCSVRMRLGGTGGADDYATALGVVFLDPDVSMYMNLYGNLATDVHFPLGYIGDGTSLGTAQPGGFGTVALTYVRSPPSVTLTTDLGTRSFPVDASVWSANAEIDLGPGYHRDAGTSWTFDYEDVICDVTY